MEEYLHNFKAIEKGRGPSPLNSVECELFELLVFIERTRDMG
jgi:hypothetical protein